MRVKIYIFKRYTVINWQAEKSYLVIWKCAWCKRKSGASSASVSKRRRHNLTQISNVCEAASISLYLAPNGLNELPEMRLKFPTNLTGKPIIAFLAGQSWRELKSWCPGEGHEKGVRRCFADVLNQKFSSVCIKAIKKKGQLNSCSR